jgi:Family of unknown function (DUF6502)
MAQMTASSLNHARREYERALTAMFGLLIHCGLRKQAISVMTRRAYTAAMAKAQAFRKSDIGELATLGLVLDAWHRDRRYLTSRGRPRAVPLLGKHPSVEALVRMQGGKVGAVQLAHRIRSLNLIEPRSGARYRPISDSALVSRYGPTVLQYVAQSLMSLLETVEHNLRNGPNMPPLLERSAEVPTLPVECLEPFKQFSESQGSVFIKTINDWLETRRVRGQVTDRQRAVRAGVHLYVYTAPTETGQGASTAGKR